MANKSDKKSYNQSYYLKNKERILARARKKEESTNPGSSNVFTLFQSDISKELTESEATSRKKPGFFAFEGLLLSTLVLAMTYFLVSESQRFYFEIDGSASGAWLKALILEGSAIVFSIVQSKNRLGAFGYKLILLFICSYSVWVISSSAIQKAIHDQRAFVVAQKNVQELESETSRIESIRDRSWDLDRITLGRKYDSVLLNLRNKLDQDRRQMVQFSDLKVVLNTLASAICFRLLVMISNLSCLRLLKRQVALWERV